MKPRNSIQVSGFTVKFIPLLLSLLALVLIDCTPKKKHDGDADGGKDVRTPLPFQRYAETPDKAAEVALAFLKSSAAKDSLWARYGFKSPKDLESAELGEPVAYFVVRCSSLTEKDTPIRSKKDLRALSGDAPLLYPVQSGKETRIGIWVDSLPPDSFFVNKADKGSWSMVRMGGASLAQSAMRGMAQVREKAKPKHPPVLVDIPVTYQVLAAYEDGGEMVAETYRDEGKGPCRIPPGNKMKLANALQRIKRCQDFSILCSWSPSDSGSSMVDPSPNTIETPGKPTPYNRKNEAVSQ